VICDNYSLVCVRLQYLSYFAIIMIALGWLAAFLTAATAQQMQNLNTTVNHNIVPIKTYSVVE
jgi:hypothetical protein